MKKRQKKEETNRKKEEFLKKFFPDCKNSPGGTQKLVINENRNSARITGVRKMKLPESFLDNPAGQCILLQVFPHANGVQNLISISSFFAIQSFGLGGGVEHLLVLHM